MATFVLVHGSFQGGWIWQHAANRLRAAGHRVYAPSLDGCGERKGTVRPGITTETHADEIAQLLFYEDLKDVVLVGTSSGGMVVCRAAELMRDRVGRLVFVDALALFDGESLRDIVTRSTDITEHAAELPADMVVAAGAGDQRLYVIPSRRLTIVRQAKLDIMALAAGKRSGWSDAHFLDLLLKP